jgi:hypothetical protein
VTDPTGARSGTEHTSSPSGPIRWVLRVIRAVALTLLAIVLFWVCDRIFAGYPQAHSALLTDLAVLVMALIGGITWIIDERRPHDDQ